MVPTRRGAGSSTPSTGRRIFCMACRIGRFRSPSSTRARSSRRVVFDPAKDEMFVAEKGQGAWMNESRIRVSGRKAMPEALLRDRRSLRHEKDAAGHDARSRAADARDARACGAGGPWRSTSPMSRRDGSTHSGSAKSTLGIWRPGSLLVREAGGFAEAVREGREIFDSGSIVAANGEIFATLTKVLRAPE